MAIQRFASKEEVASSGFEGLFLGLNNGDRAAVEQVMQRWDFRDEESFLRFVVAVMIKTEGNKLFIQAGGAQTAISPSDALLHPKQ